ncbi:MAG: molybdenum cofactor biosynthesis protein MoaE [Nocardioidaceae bacterium]
MSSELPSDRPSDRPSELPTDLAENGHDDASVVRLVDLRETPIDVTEVLAAVETVAGGGLDIFVGTVRDHDHGHGVTGLEYDAHPSALDRLREVTDKVATGYDVLAVAAVHRVGRLALGDVAVVVAAAAVHREEAFAATRALIDDLKATVPIWKHQLFDDGSDEWVGTP